MTYSCRHCGAPLHHEVIDLGHQPPSNAYLTADQLLKPEVTYPLKVYLCTQCWLMQLPAHAAAAELFTADYAYFSSTSSSWCAHAERFVTSAIQRLGLTVDSQVVEIASNDGYLLQYVQQQGIPCLGIEPTQATAAAARAKGIETLEQFFGAALAADLVMNDGLVAGGADLVVANNVLAHVPDINDFMAGIVRLLKPTGRAAIEFPHLLRLLAGNQFDTIYHEHYSYLSLRLVQRLATMVGLMVEDVEELSTHGGSLRVWLSHRDMANPTMAVDKVLMEEAEAGLETTMAYIHFQHQAEAAKNALLSFLLTGKGERSSRF
jgi:SAM-dependent methyltransferase